MELMRSFILAASLAGSSTVYTDLTQSFNCNGAHSLAIADLIMQCEAIGKKLSRVTSYSCELSGDDGGYVDYYSIRAVAECNEI